MTLSRDVKQQIVTLSQHTTKSKREIARDVGVSEGIVRLTLKTWDETGSLEKHGEGRSGCKPKMTNRDVRKLVIESKKDPKKSARDLQQCLADAGAGISLRTIQRNLLKGGRKVYRPIKTPIISKANGVKRLLWAQQMKDVTEEEWEKVWQYLMWMLLFVYC
jgi:transposase